VQVDRIYCGAPDTLYINNSSSTIQVVRSGFPDVVLWNPHIEKAAAMSDFGDDEWRRMVCLEAAQAGSGAVEVAPGETWCASQTVRVEDN
jgi:glucose-6-phosphate 1-epimerase